MTDVVGHSRPASRASLVAELFSDVRSFVFDQTNRSYLGATEREELFTLYLETSHLSTALAAATHDEAAVVELERDRIRPLVHRLRRFALRRNVTLAVPFWGCPPVQANPNCVFFSGGARLPSRLLALLAERRLDQPESPRGWGVGQLCWHRLRQSAVGIFDLTSESSNSHASTGYALGCALALGVYPVVVTDPGSPPPFDIDVAPSTAAGLADGLDRALFGFHITVGSGSVRETSDRVLSSVPGDGAAGVVSGQLKERLAQDQDLDAIEAVAFATDLLARSHGRGEWTLLYPIWPAAYAAPGDERCFHVTHFDHSFDAARDAVRAACDAASVRYRRADEINQANVMRSIWEEISMARYVLVDITGLSTNVACELGIAHALGRETLFVSRRNGTVATLATRFPEVARLQVWQYSDAAELKSLVAAQLDRADNGGKPG